MSHYTTEIAPPVDLAVGRWAGRQVGRSGVGGRQSLMFVSGRTPGTHETSFRALLCHPERSEGSRSASSGSLNKDQGEIPRSARNDRQFQSGRQRSLGCNDIMSWLRWTGRIVVGRILLKSQIRLPPQLSSFVFIDILALFRRFQCLQPVSRQGAKNADDAKSHHPQPLLARGGEFAIPLLG